MARQTTKGAPTRAEAQKTISSFERAFSTVDAAVTGALIAGVHPYSFEAVLSFSFLDAAAGARGKNVDSYTRSKPMILDPIMESIEEFCDEFDGGLNDQGEGEEFASLLDQCLDGDFKKLSEIEQHRYNKLAVAVVEWCTLVLGRDEELPTILVELCFLVAYLKVSALAGDIDPDVYFIVKQSVPMVWDVYEHVLTSVAD